MTDLVVPLTLEQEWFFARRIADGGVPMAVTRAFDINGPLDIGRFLAAFRTVVSRHQGMRTAIGIDERGEPHQVIRPPSDDVPLICQAVACRSREQFEEYARRAAWADRMSRWNPVRDPLYRMRLLRSSENEHILLATFDHLAFDDRAVQLFFHYLWAEYGGAPDMAADAGNLAAAVRAERDRYASRAAGRNARYWAGRYALAPATWVADEPGEQQVGSGYERDAANLDLDADSAAEIQAAVSQAGATTLGACVSVFAWTVFQLTAHERVAIYLPFDNRGPAERGVIGNFACVRPLVVYRTDGPPAAYLDQVAGQIFRALAHRHLDGRSESHCEQLQLAGAQAARVQRSLGVNYLRMDGAEIPASPAPGLSLQRVGLAHLPPSRVAASLQLIVRESPEEWRFSLVHTKRMLSSERASAVLSLYVAQLTAFGSA